MKEIVSLLILLGLLFAQDALSQQKNKHDKQNIATEYLDKNFGTYDALQKKIWEMPELGFIETESSKQLQEHLEANGFTVGAQWKQVLRQPYHKSLEKEIKISRKPSFYL